MFSLGFLCSFSYLGSVCLFCVFGVFFFHLFCVVSSRAIAWKDSSPKWPIKGYCVEREIKLLTDCACCSWSRHVAVRTSVLLCVVMPRVPLTSWKDTSSMETYWRSAMMLSIVCIMCNYDRWVNCVDMHNTPPIIAIVNMISCNWLVLLSGWLFACWH